MKPSWIANPISESPDSNGEVASVGDAMRRPWHKPRLRSSAIGLNTRGQPGLLLDGQVQIAQPSL